jgi:NAD(P)-dependent dehydrogenase (short-subunit alcohol dehydrogenase family)
MLEECLERQDMFDEKLLELNGARSLVVGITGGLGLEIAHSLKQARQDVFGIGRNKEKLNQLKKYDFEIASLDITCEDSIIDFAKSCPAFDNIILCNGINGPRPARMCNDNFVRSVLDNNLIGSINLISNLLRKKKIASPGRVVFMSSISCHIAATNSAAYAASKGGGEAFFRGLARELMKKDITVNSVAPAAIETPIFEGNRPKVLNPDLYPLSSGHPSDVSNAVLFLLQNGARFITGETLILDGGATWLE